jgi:hypothetical protein
MPETSYKGIELRLKIVSVLVGDSRSRIDIEKYWKPLPLAITKFCRAEMKALKDENNILRELIESIDKTKKILSDKQILFQSGLDRRQLIVARNAILEYEAYLRSKLSETVKLLNGSGNGITNAMIASIFVEREEMLHLWRLPKEVEKLDKTLKEVDSNTRELIKELVDYQKLIKKGPRAGDDINNLIAARERKINTIFRKFESEEEQHLLDIIAWMEEQGMHFPK